MEPFLRSMRRRLERDRNRLHAYHDDLRRASLKRRAALAGAVGERADADRRRETLRVAAIEREYHARVRGAIAPGEREKLLKGIDLDGAPARFDSIEELRAGEGSNRWYRVVLREGRNREVRRLFEALGHAVSRLVRVRYGPIELPADLAPGSWRELRNPAILQRL